MTPLPPDAELAIEQLAAALAPAPVVLVGASAIDRHLPLTWRKTNDLDIVAAASLDHDAIPPFVLGRTLSTILKPPHRERVERFLARVEDEDSHHHYQMRRLGPYGRFDDGDSPVTPRLAAFRLGLGA